MIPKLNENILLIKSFMTVHLHVTSFQYSLFIFSVLLIHGSHTSARGSSGVYVLFLLAEMCIFWNVLYFIIYFLFIFISFSLRTVFQIYLDFFLFNKCSQNGHVYKLFVCIGREWDTIMLQARRIEWLSGFKLQKLKV